MDYTAKIVIYVIALKAKQVFHQNNRFVGKLEG